MSRFLDFLVIPVVLVVLILSAINLLRPCDNDYEERIQRLEIANCSWIQLEDYSVVPRAQDSDRFNCVDYVLGNAECDRIVRNGHEYLINCRQEGR